MLNEETDSIYKVIILKSLLKLGKFSLSCSRKQDKIANNIKRNAGNCQSKRVLQNIPKENRELRTHLCRETNVRLTQTRDASNRTLIWATF